LLITVLWLYKSPCCLSAVSHSGQLPDYSQLRATFNDLTFTRHSLTVSPISLSPEMQPSFPPNLQYLHKRNTAAYPLNFVKQLARIGLNSNVDFFIESTTQMRQPDSCGILLHDLLRRPISHHSVCSVITTLNHTLVKHDN